MHHRDLNLPPSCNQETDSLTTKLPRHTAKTEVVFLIGCREHILCYVSVRRLERIEILNAIPVFVGLRNSKMVL